MDVKFGRYTYRVHPSKSPLKNFEKRDRGHIQGLPNFWGTPIISATGKATDFKFGRYIYRVQPSKSPLSFSRKGPVGISRDSPIFGGTTYYLGNE